MIISIIEPIDLTSYPGIKIDSSSTIFYEDEIIEAALVLLVDSQSRLIGRYLWRSVSTWTEPFCHTREKMAKDWTNYHITEPANQTQFMADMGAFNLRISLAQYLENILNMNPQQYPFLELGDEDKYLDFLTICRTCIEEETSQ